MKTMSILFVLFVSLVSCKKQTPCTHEASKGTPISSVSRDGRDPSYSNNPYDYNGYRHNEMLDEMKSYLIANSDATLASVVDHIEDWYENAYNGVVDLDPNDMEAFVANPVPTFDDEDVEDYYNQMKALTDAVSEETRTNSDYAQFKNDMIAIEDAIMEDMSLSSSQKEALLGTASVARYSADYWWTSVPVTGGTFRTAQGTDRAAFIHGLGTLGNVGALVSSAVCSGIVGLIG